MVSASGLPGGTFERLLLTTSGARQSLGHQNDIVQVEKTCLPLQSGQDKYHKPLQGLWSITETKRHYLEFK